MAEMIYSIIIFRHFLIIEVSKFFNFSAIFFQCVKKSIQMFNIEFQTKKIYPKICWPVDCGNKNGYKLFLFFHSKFNRYHNFIDI